MVSAMILMAIATMLPSIAQAQTSVALAPVPAQQFFSQAGQPLASGCIWTYISGTSTPLATYTSYTGVTQNTNPIILDGGGFAQIWLSNSTYRFVIYASDGLNDNCASGALQRTVDGISAYTILNQAQNIFLAGASSDPAGTAGELYYNTTLGCFRGFSTFWDCFVTLTGPQTLTNKTLPSATLSTPTITGAVSGAALIPSSDIVSSYPTNTNLPGVSNLVKLVTVGGVSQATFTALTDTSGVIGICIANCSTSTAQIQETGTTTCQFDGATTAGDYIQISTSLLGVCHDAGASYPSTGQVLGRVLSTNGGQGTYPVNLFPPEIRAGTIGAQTGCTNFTPATVANNNTQQNLLSCSIAANALLQGSLLSVDITGLSSTASAQSITIGMSLGAGTPCTTTVSTGVANNQVFNVIGKFAVLTTGATGTANWSCEGFSSNGAAGGPGIIGTPTIAVNTTISNVLQITVQMSVANAGNSTTGQLLKAVIY
jgi:hypothetical protein